MSTQPSASPPKQEPRGMGVSMSPEAADAIDTRVAELSKAYGFRFTRSSYFEMLSRYDHKHHIIERMFTTPK